MRAVRAAARPGRLVTVLSRAQRTHGSTFPLLSPWIRIELSGIVSRMARSSGVGSIALSGRRRRRKGCRVPGFFPGQWSDVKSSPTDTR